jgi:UDP-N-acetylglucosamine--N-acetylmuramyl-(pentapeptide) pyrophosphoryl-undecaprenol N-acetylglucosamine transferase
MERVVLTTGGTGGHIFPALAVAEEIRNRFPAARVLFVGGTRGPEAELAGRAGLEFLALPGAGMLGRGLRSISAAGTLSRGVAQAVAALRRFRPDAVLGFGGYAAVAAVTAAVVLRVPAAVHEQNSVPGMANRLLGRLVRRVFLSFKDTMGMFNPRKCVLTGNPVRRDIRELAGNNRNNLFERRNLLVLGGSQGARAINATVLEALPGLKESGVNLWHQTGPTSYDKVRKIYGALDMDPACVSAFIDDMAGAYAWADLVLCRAGATTVAELAVAGKPAVFIPFPYATHNHQYMNAKSLQDAGGALLITEEELPGRDLAGLVSGLLGDPGRLRAMARAAKKHGRADAAARVVDEMQRLVAR